MGRLSTDPVPSCESMHASVRSTMNINDLTYKFTQHTVIVPDVPGQGGHHLLPASTAAPMRNYTMHPRADPGDDQRRFHSNNLVIQLLYVRATCWGSRCRALWAEHHANHRLAGRYGERMPYSTFRHLLRRLRRRRSATLCTKKAGRDCCSTAATGACCGRQTLSVSS